MLDFERELVAALSSSSEPRLRAGIASFVEGSLDDMPEFLRLGVVVESIAFSAFAKVRRRSMSALIEMLESSPISLIRQYVRLFRSLVLFAEQELTTS
ncbi:MAG TPA: hypothetical protein VM143_00850 [Acidimicrobiales bacterium]|nr:hypothetical protein [Acidimicrobiales bacterium]